MDIIKFKGIDKQFNAIAVYGENSKYTEAPHEIVSNSERSVIEIHFPATEDYSDLISVYNNEDALSEITITDGTSNEIYVHLNYIIQQSLSLRSYGTTQEVAMYGPDRWIMTLAQLTEADKQFRKLVGVASKSVAYLTLDEYKEVKIQLSKEKLETYLKNNPLISNCKDSVYKEYTVTTDKQNQFAAQFAVYMANKMAGVEDIFTWNEKGQPCVPWDEASCIRWMNAAKAYTKPLVQAQQAYEVAVTEMTTKVEVENFDIDYSTVNTTNGKTEWVGHTDAEVNAIEQQTLNNQNHIAAI